MNQTILKAIILKELSCESRRYVSEIAEHLGYLRPSVSRAMHQLEQEGLIAYDRKRWSLTEQGRNCLLTQDQVYAEQISPLVKKIAELARCYRIPFVVSFEVEGWLVTDKRLEDACSEIKEAYGNLTGEWN